MSPAPLRPVRHLSQPEFIAMSAMLFATIAFSVDAMLPAFPAIAAELSPADPNRVQLVVTSFILGMGLGTLFSGPISDALGRKPVIIGGATIYCIAALLAWSAQSLEMLLAARVLQGLGASGPRVVVLAIVRDLYSGRKMAKIVSFVMMVFTLFPAFAPLIGAGIIALSGWRAIFLAFLLFSLVSASWVTLRQAETLAPENRRAFRPAALWEGIVEVLTNRRVLLTIAAQSLIFAILFANVASNQQVFDISYGRAESFPYWFAGVALFSGTASFLNSQIVERLGMRHVVTVTLTVQLVISSLLCLVMVSGLVHGDMSFAVYMLWNISVFYMVGLTIGNLNALAMEPMGHMAGMAASIVGSVATVLAVLVAIPIGLAFDGTPVPLMLGAAVCSAASLAIMTRLRDRPGEVA